MNALGDLKDIWIEYRDLNQKRSLRQNIHSLMFSDPYSGRLHHIFDIIMMAVIIMAVLIVVLESVEFLRIKYYRVFAIFEIIISILFIAEYLCRIFSIVEEKKFSRPWLGRLKYAVTPISIVDLLAIAPILITPIWGAGVEILWVLRLLRIFKFSRYSYALSLIFSVLKEERFALAGALFIFSNLIMISAGLIYVFEHQAQPDKFSNIPMSIYWAVVTLTSIGYGDIYPITAPGQMLTMLLAVIGIGMVALPAGILANGFVEKLHSQKRNLMKFVGERADDKLISASEQREIDHHINEIGMSPARGNLVEKEIFDQLGVIQTHYTEDGLRLVFRNSNDRETITNWIAGLKREDKLAMLALITASLKNDSTTP